MIHGSNIKQIKTIVNNQYLHCFTSDSDEGSQLSAWKRGSSFIFIAIISAIGVLVLVLGVGLE